MSEITHEVDIMEQILNDVALAEIVNCEIKSIRNKRHEILANSGRSGAKFKRSPWDYLKERGLLNGKALVIEFRMIINRTSSHPSTVRGFIESIVKPSIVKLLEKSKEERKDK